MKNKVPFILMMFPILYILMPRPELPGAEFATFPILFVILGFSIIYYSSKKELGIPRVSGYVVYTLVLILSCVYLSIAFSHQVGLFEIVSNTSKYLLLITTFVFAMTIARHHDLDDIKKALLKSSYIIIVFQIIFSVIQLLDFQIFTYIYSMDKTRPLGGLVRVAGTLGNPNYFGWIMIQIAVIIQLFEGKRKKKIAMILLAFILTFFSGSRTMLVMFPAIIAFVYFLKSKKTVKFVFIKTPLALIALFSLWKFSIWFLTKYQYQFPYLSQLLSILDTGDLTSVNSFDARTIMWSNAMNLYESDSSPLKFLFGIGTGTVNTMDNDYLLSFVNNGILFTVINISLFLTLLITIFFTRDKMMKILGVQYIIFTFIISFQSDTLTGWNYPLLALYFSGLIIGANLRNKKITRIQ